MFVEEETGAEVNAPLRLRLRLSMRRLGASGVPHLPVKVKPKITRWVRIFLVRSLKETQRKELDDIMEQETVQNPVHREKPYNREEEDAEAKRNCGAKTEALKNAY